MESPNTSNNNNTFQPDHSVSPDHAPISSFPKSQSNPLVYPSDSSESSFPSDSVSNSQSENQPLNQNKQFQEKQNKQNRNFPKNNQNVQKNNQNFQNSSQRRSNARAAKFQKQREPQPQYRPVQAPTYKDEKPKEEKSKEEKKKNLFPSGLPPNFLTHKTLPPNLQNESVQHLSFLPNAQQATVLNHLYPDTIFIRKEMPNNHGIAHFIKDELANHLFQKLTGFSIVDVGGDLAYHLRRQSRKISIVNPYNTTYDVSRNLVSKIQSDKIIEEIGDKTELNPATQIRKDLLDHKCNCQIQDCHHQEPGRVYTFIHSAYYIPPHELFIAMHQLKARAFFLISYDYSGGKSGFHGESVYETVGAPDIDQVVVHSIEKIYNHFSYNFLQMQHQMDMGDFKVQWTIEKKLGGQIIYAFDFNYSPSFVPHSLMLPDVDPHSPIMTFDLTINPKNESFKTSQICQELSTATAFSYTGSVHIIFSNKKTVWIPRGFLQALRTHVSYTSRNVISFHNFLDYAKQLIRKFNCDPIDVERILLYAVPLAFYCNVNDELGMLYKIETENEGTKYAFNNVLLTQNPERDAIDKLTHTLTFTLNKLFKTPIVFRLGMYPRIGICTAALFCGIIITKNTLTSVRPAASPLSSFLLSLSTGAIILVKRSYILIKQFWFKTPIVVYPNEPIVTESMCPQELPLETLSNDVKIKIEDPNISRDDCAPTFGTKLMLITPPDYSPQVVRNCPHSIYACFRNRLAFPISPMLSLPGFSQLREQYRTTFIDLTQPAPFIVPNLEKYLTRGNFTLIRQAQIRTNLSLLNKEGHLLKDIKLWLVFLKKENLYKRGPYKPRPIFSTHPALLGLVGPFLFDLQQFYFNRFSHDHDLNPNRIIISFGLDSISVAKIFMNEWLTIRNPVCIDGDISHNDHSFHTSLQSVQWELWLKAGMDKSSFKIYKNLFLDGPFIKIRKGKYVLTSKLQPMLPTGCQETAFANSMNSATILTMFEKTQLPGFPALKVTAGDDQKMIIDADRLRPTAAADYTNCFTKLGFDVKVKISNNIHESEFCSKLIWPCLVNNQSSFIMTPKPGRLLKICWLNKNLSVIEEELWFKNIAICLAFEANHLPIFRTLISKMFELKKISYIPYNLAVQNLKSIGVDHGAHLSNETHPIAKLHPDVIPLFCKRYATQPDIIQDVETIIENLTSLPAIINHPLLTKMIEIDNDLSILKASSFLDRLLEVEINVTDIPIPVFLTLSCLVVPVFEEILKEGVDYVIYSEGFSIFGTFEYLSRLYKFGLPTLLPAFPAFIFHQAVHKYPIWTRIACHAAFNFSAILISQPHIRSFLLNSISHVSKFLSESIPPIIAKAIDGFNSLIHNY
jgi:hypothetical protein